MASSILKRERRRRLISSASGYAFSLVALLIAALVGVIRLGPAQSRALSIALDLVLAIVMVLLVVALVAFVIQTNFEYRKRTHDPTWSLRYQDVFDKMIKARFEASRTLIEQDGHLGDIDGNGDALSQIDDVLDFFDDLGFYENGGHISPETTHHHFYHWLRMYWQASRDYVEAWRRKEPARWNHIDELFETTSEVEMEESECTRSEIALSRNDLRAFLDQERDFCAEGSTSGESTPAP